MSAFVKSFLVGLVLVITFCLVAVEVNAQGCVMCRSQVGASKDKDQAKMVGASLNTGILYLMAAPYLLVGTIGFIWYRQNRKKNA